MNYSLQLWENPRSTCFQFLPKRSRERSLIAIGGRVEAKAGLWNQWRSWTEYWREHLILSNFLIKYEIKHRLVGTVLET